MSQAVSPQPPVEGLLDILREAVLGGEPGQGTSFLDGTAGDGSGNHGLIATLAALSAEQASRDLGGTSVAGHARHVALHLEVAVRWDRGERGPFGWKESFLPLAVDAAGWTEVQGRVRRAYDAVVALAHEWEARPLDGDVTGGLAGAAAHVAYHLGAIRQMVKALDGGTGHEPQPMGSNL